MPEFEKVEYEFPDEKEAKQQAESVEEEKVEATGKPEVEIEIEDDTPEQDRGREPLPKEVVQELEADELDDYSEKVKIRLKQMKKVWHDERREKEAALREREEAIRAAQTAIEENRRLKQSVDKNQEALIEQAKARVVLEIEQAKKKYKEAYEAGDTDAVLAAQEDLTSAKIKADRLMSFKPKALQTEENDVKIQPQQIQRPAPDAKAQAWHTKNTWFGQDEEMTSLALGLHEKLRSSGVPVGSEEYYKRIDATMRKRFPENFEDSEDLEVKTVEEKPQRTKPSTVVAPATRSTSAKKVRLTQSQVAIAKKLGLTPEQYVRELMKMEA